MIEITLLEKLNSSNYRWWDVSDRIKKLLVENGCIQVNNKVVKDLNALVPVDSFVKRVFRNRDLGNTEYNFYLDGFYARKPFAINELQGSGTTSRKLINIRRDTSSQSLFKNKKYLKEYYKIKNHEIDSLVNLETRLDVLVVRLGFTDGLDNSRELISKGSIFVDNKPIYRANFKVKVGQVITTNIPVSISVKSYDWLYKDGPYGVLINRPKRSGIELPKRLLPSLL